MKTTRKAEDNLVYDFNNNLQLSLHNLDIIIYFGIYN